MQQSTATTVRVEGLETTLAILKTIEPDSINQIRSEIRQIVNASGAISKIKSRTPAVAPLSGMANNGPIKWAGVKRVNVSVLPKITSFGYSSKPLVRIAVTGGATSLGFDYAELAGIRRAPPRARSKIRGTGTRGTQKGDGSMALNGQGDNFIRYLEDRNGKSPGRFAFRAVLDTRGRIMFEIQKTLDRFAERLNMRLK